MARAERPAQSVNLNRDDEVPNIYNIPWLPCKQPLFDTDCAPMGVPIDGVSDPTPQWSSCFFCCRGLEQYQAAEMMHILGPWQRRSGCANQSGKLFRTPTSEDTFASTTKTTIICDLCNTPDP